MKNIKIALTLLLIGLVQLGIGQEIQDLYGKWKLSPLKVLTLNTDQTFAYKKGAFDYEGTYSIATKYGDKHLIMVFTEKTVEYLIADFTDTTIELIDVSNNITINAKIIEKYDVETVDNTEKDETENVTQDKSQNPYDSGTTSLQNEGIENPKEDPFEEDAFKPQSPWIVSLFAGASMNSISNPSLVDNSYSYNAVDRSIKYANELGYQGGINLAYEVVEGFYLGSGISVTNVSFSETINLYQAENSQVTDLTVNQKTKYSVFGIQVPLTAHISISKKLKLEVKGIGSQFLKSTAKANSTLSGSYIEKSTNDEVIYYEDNKSSSYENGVESISLGYGVELQYYFAKHLGLSVFYNRNNGYFKYEQKVIDGINIGANVVMKF